MAAEGWIQIEAIYHSALDRSTEERASFIAEACAGGVELRSEIEDLVRRWRRDSRELFYMTEQDAIASFAVDDSHDALRLGSPTPLFTAPCACEFDGGGDGQRFFVRGAAGADSTAPTTVLNWKSERKTR